MAAANTDEETAFLLTRLQSQFGDINLSNLLNPNESPVNNESDEESSLEEPTPEELLQWQEAQFQKGRMKLEAQKLKECGDANKAGLLARRREKSVQERSLLRSYDEEDEDWEKLSRLPDLGGQTSAFFPVTDNSEENSIHPSLQMLAEADPEVLGTEWKILYSSSQGDGLSFHNLCERIRGYKGPTILMLGGEPSSSKCSSYDSGKGENSRVALGFFTTDYWIESPDSFGSDDDCFLFSLDYETNNVQILRPKSRSAEATSLSTFKTQKFIYCHSSSNTLKSKNNSIFGIGIGGSPSQQPRLHLTESLEECRCLPYDTLFDDGDLLLGKCNDSLYYFDIDTLEVWGVGGEQWIQDALSAQLKEREMRKGALEKARRVDKKQLLEHFENGVLRNCGGGGGLFGHLDFVDDRDVDCCATIGD